MEKLNCKKCGSWLIDEHPIIKGLFVNSSDYIDGSNLCVDCLEDEGEEKICKDK